MRFLFGRTVREVKRIRVHLASPMTPDACADLGHYLVDRVLDPITFDAQVIASRILRGSDDQPVAGEVEITVVAHTPGDAYGRLIEELESDGVARGSFLVCDGERLPIGAHEVLLLRCRADTEAETATRAIAPVLEAREAWVEDHYAAPTGPVLVLICASAADLHEALTPLLASHEDLAGAALEHFPAVHAGD